MYTTSFVDLPLEELLTRVQTLKHEGIRFVQMCAETTEQGIDLLYTFYDETTQTRSTCASTVLTSRAAFPRSKVSTSPHSRMKTRPTTCMACGS